jgi:tetratricopeptide (TPR) repeat protein
MKKPREAKTALAKALLWNPTGLISMFEYMEALKQLNDYETYGHLARMSFRYAFRKGQFARCLRNMGFYLIEIDDYASAAVCFQESLQWEDAGTAKSELDYIRHVTGDPIPEVTEELKEEVSDEYNISFTPNKQVTGLAYQMAKNNYNDGDYKASRYFFEILYELTNDEEILDLLGYLSNKGGTEDE